MDSEVEPQMVVPVGLVGDSENGNHSIHDTGPCRVEGNPAQVGREGLGEHNSDGGLGLQSQALPSKFASKEAMNTHHTGF